MTIGKYSSVPPGGKVGEGPGVALLAAVEAIVTGAEAVIVDAVETARDGKTADT